jgi:predicted DNA-binding helix-hairpin-helix protein
MFYNVDVDALTRLKLLSSDMDWETGEESQPHPHCFTPRHQDQIVIYPAKIPGGAPIRLLKSLLSSACERNCYYCPFRAGRDSPRVTFKPHEFAHLFFNLYQAGVAQGVFLSSGLAGGGIRTQDKLLDAAEILREKLQFRGYIHLKLMPGAELDQVWRAMQLADRVSINLEAPTPQTLAQLAPQKNFYDEILQPLKWVEEIRRSQPPTTNWQGRWPSTVTQFVVGAADESDYELLNATEWLQRNLRLARAYYSPFKPVPNTPFENKTPTNPLRQHRLYQAAFLLRDYHFSLPELNFLPGGNLPLDSDPKHTWAERNLRHAPVELNTADPQQLIRIPGIGPKAAQRILNARKHHRLQDISVLGKLGVQTHRAAPFILLDGKRPSTQLTLFSL